QPLPSDAEQPKQRNNSPHVQRMDVTLTGDTRSVPNDTFLHDLVTQACLATDATAAALALKSGEEFICRAVAGPHTPDIGVRLDVRAGLSGACVRAKKAQYCEDTETDPRVDAQLCRRLQVRSILIVPVLIAESDILGVLEVFSPQPQAFGHHDLQNL